MILLKSPPRVKKVHPLPNDKLLGSQLILLHVIDPLMFTNHYTTLTWHFFLVSIDLAYLSSQIT